MISGKKASGSLVLPSRPSAVIKVCEDILPALKARGYSGEDVFGVHLALEEAFINAVAHGNKGNPEKKVSVSYTVGEHEVAIEVTDEGGGFDPGDVPDPRCGENIYKTDGRGLFLMRAYMDKLEFSEGGKRVRMVKYKSCGKKGPKTGS